MHVLRQQELSARNLKYQLLPEAAPEQRDEGQLNCGLVWSSFLVFAVPASGDTDNLSVVCDCSALPKLYRWRLEAASL